MVYGLYSGETLQEWICTQDGTYFKRDEHTDVWRAHTRENSCIIVYDGDTTRGNLHNGAERGHTARSYHHKMVYGHKRHSSHDGV